MLFLFQLSRSVQTEYVPAECEWEVFAKAIILCYCTRSETEEKSSILSVGGLKSANA